MGFHHDGQAGLELLTSGDPPILASQSGRITGVSHRAQPLLAFSSYQSGRHFKTRTGYRYRGNMPLCLILIQTIWLPSPDKGIR